MESLRALYATSFYAMIFLSGDALDAIGELVKGENDFREPIEEVLDTWNDDDTSREEIRTHMEELRRSVLHAITRIKEAAKADLANSTKFPKLW